MSTRRIVQLLSMAGLVMLSGICGNAWGGENHVYVKSGYFNWNEKINGADFVKESGMINAFGVGRSDIVFGNVTLDESIELWGGSLDYDGHDVTNTTILKTDTVYLGTREEFEAGIKFPVTGNLAVGPLAGVGHKFWVRTRSSEDWNSIYGKFGGAADYAAGSHHIFVKSGVSIPFYTRSHVNLSSAGFEDVTTNPKSEPGVFAEAGVRLSSWSFSVGYEEMNFGESDKVTTRSTTPLQNGVAVINSQAFQPESSSSLVSLKIEYHF